MLTYRWLITLGLGFLWMSIPSAFATPRLNEFSAAGQHYLEDKDGDFSDWIELHNPDAESASLSEHYLTDDPGHLTKWTFPRGQTIGAGQHLVILASGKDRNDIFRGTIHSNFRLEETTDGFLALVAPDGVTIIDQIEGYPKQRLGRTYGRDAHGDLAYFATPTPGKANTDPSSDFVKDTKFSVDRGFHDAAFDLIISSATQGATIHYTLDGSLPSPDQGLVYEQALRVDQSTIVRAMAFADRLVPSDVDTQTYLFISSILTQPEDPEGFPARWGPVPANYEFDAGVATEAQFREALLSYPSISLVTDIDSWFNASRTEGEGGIYANSTARGSGWEKLVSAEFINFEGLDDTQVDCGMRVYGNASRQTSRPKHNMRLVFRSQYGPSKLDFPVFGKGKATGINGLLFNGQNGDSWFHPAIGQRTAASYIRDHFAHEILGDMGHLTPPQARAHLYVNGLYWGFYQTVERVDHHFMARLLGGEAEEYDSMKASIQEGPTVVAGDSEAYDEMFRIANDGLETDLAYASIQNYLNMDQYIDYMLVNFWSGNRDWDGNNWRNGRHRSNGSPFHYFLWDSENMFKDEGINRFTTNTANNPTRLHQRLKENSDYQLKFADRVRRHLYNDGVLTEDAVKARWQRWADYIRPGLFAESARWGDHHRSGNPHTVEEDFDEALADLLENMFPARAKNTERQLQSAGLYPLEVQAVEIEPHGGEVESGATVQFKAGSIFTPQPGDILYSLDGLDPMQGGGLTYERAGTGIILETSANVSVRLRNPDGKWGPLTEARFRIGAEPQPGQLLISEIHYHPSDPTPAENPDGRWSATDFEFIAVQNVSDLRLNLEGLAFVEGIRYTFPNRELEPGEQMLVAESPEAFASRYGTSSSAVLGPFTGKLANGGEQVTLVNASGVVLHGVLYDDTDPWPASPDGDGDSLKLQDTSKPELAASWTENSPSPANLDQGGDVPNLPSEPLKAVFGVAEEQVSLSITASTDLLLTLERSLDLSTWIADEASAEVTPGIGGLQNHQWQSTAPAEGLTLFYRLRVQAK